MNPVTPILFPASRHRSPALDPDGKHGGFDHEAQVAAPPAAASAESWSAWTARNARAAGALALQSAKQFGTQYLTISLVERVKQRFSDDDLRPFEQAVYAAACAAGIAYLTLSNKRFIDSVYTSVAREGAVPPPPLDSRKTWAGATMVTMAQVSPSLGAALGLLDALPSGVKGAAAAAAYSWFNGATRAVRDVQQGAVNPFLPDVELRGPNGGPLDARHEKGFRRSHLTGMVSGYVIASLMCSSTIKDPILAAACTEGVEKIIEGLHAFMYASAKGYKVDAKAAPALAWPQLISEHSGADLLDMIKGHAKQVMVKGEMRSSLVASAQVSQWIRAISDSGTASVLDRALTGIISGAIEWVFIEALTAKAKTQDMDALVTNIAREAVKQFPVLGSPEAVKARLLEHLQQNRPPREQGPLGTLVAAARHLFPGEASADDRRWLVEVCASQLLGIDEVGVDRYLTSVAQAEMLDQWKDTILTRRAKVDACIQACGKAIWGEKRLSDSAFTKEVLAAVQLRPFHKWSDEEIAVTVTTIAQAWCQRHDQSCPEDLPARAKPLAHVVAREGELPPAYSQFLTPDEQARLVQAGSGQAEVVDAALWDLADELDESLSAGEASGEDDKSPRSDGGHRPANSRDVELASVRRRDQKAPLDSNELPDRFNLDGVACQVQRYQDKVVVSFASFDDIPNLSFWKPLGEMRVHYPSGDDKHNPSAKGTGLVKISITQQENIDLLITRLQSQAG